MTDEVGKDLYVERDLDKEIKSRFPYGLFGPVNVAQEEYRALTPRYKMAHLDIALCPKEGVVTRYEEEIKRRYYTDENMTVPLKDVFLTREVLENILGKPDLTLEAIDSSRRRAGGNWNYDFFIEEVQKRFPEITNEFKEVSPFVWFYTDCLFSDPRESSGNFLPFLYGLLRDRIIATYLVSQWERAAALREIFFPHLAVDLSFPVSLEIEQTSRLLNNGHFFIAPGNRGIIQLEIPDKEFSLVEGFGGVKTLSGFLGRPGSFERQGLDLLTFVHEGTHAVYEVLVKAPRHLRYRKGPLIDKAVNEGVAVTMEETIIQYLLEFQNALGLTPEQANFFQEAFWARLDILNERKDHYWQGTWLLKCCRYNDGGKELFDFLKLLNSEKLVSFSMNSPGYINLFREGVSKEEVLRLLGKKEVNQQ